jgi:hypothetical protein
MATVTAGAVSAHTDDNGKSVMHENHDKQVSKKAIKLV